MVERLVLGTAQLGMDYGIANATGAPDESGALALVRAAWEGGVRSFDTAQDYGRSESVLGRCLAGLGVSDQARVISKPAPSLDLDDPGRTLPQAVEQSLSRLGVPWLYGLLLHREHILDRWDGSLGQAMRALVRDGLVERVGVSVYSPDAADRALDCPGLDLLQLPTNVLDRRFERSGVMERAASRGVEVHVRSIFLQGLLLMEPAVLPERMAHAEPVARTVGSLAAELGMTRAGLCLAYARAVLDPALILFGAETPEQVRDNLALWAAPAPDDLAERIRSAFPDVPETILNPVLWGKV